MKIKYRKATWSDLKRDLNQLLNPFAFKHISQKTYLALWFNLGVKPWFIKLDYSGITGNKFYRWEKYFKGIEGVSV